MVRGGSCLSNWMGRCLASFHCCAKTKLDPHSKNISIHSIQSPMSHYIAPNMRELTRKRTLTYFVIASQLEVR